MVSGVRLARGARGVCYERAERNALIAADEDGLERAVADKSIHRRTRNAEADCGVGITGFAGPSTDGDIPVGRVCFGFSVCGRTVGETVEFGGLLGYAPIMPVNTFSCDDFVNRPGRIPAPIHSFKN